MENNHTPGPWEIKAYSDTILISHYSGMGSNEPVARAEPARSPAIREANARLISAAPELLDLAYQYLSDLRYPPTGDSLQRRIERAEKVIAKARGIA